MKKLFALVIAFATFSCTSNAQKTSFSETALSETLLAQTEVRSLLKTLSKSKKEKQQ